MLSRRTPPVTKFLVISNLILFLFTSILIPGLMGLPMAEHLMQLLGLSSAAFWQGAVWQPLTAMFLHGGLLHVAFNMIALWSIGMFLERILGTARFAWLYFISGMGGAAAVILFQQQEGITIGASGAVMGLVAAMAYLNPNARFLLFFIIPVKARTIAIGLGILSLVLGLTDDTSHISHFGHLGGLVAGFVYIFFSSSGLHRSAQMSGGAAGPSGGGKSWHPGNGPQPGTSAGMHRQQILEQLMREFARQHTRDVPHGSRREKEINPRPDENYTSDGTDPTEHNPRAGRHIYYDPIRRQFIIRD
ncbi:MAG: rhomboid family intramembrane serine protease [Leptospiraceae bacterium]|nr:rhomboid family intramembrane serine protease [Leptospiraceae bacterium]